MTRREGPASAYHPFLDRGSATPATRQLYLGLRDAILDGTLCSGHRLPSTRLAVLEWGVSRGLVAEAYEMLIAEGYVEGRHGSGTYVTSHLPASLIGRTSPSPMAGSKPARPVSPLAANVLRSVAPVIDRTHPFATGRIVHDERASRTLRRIAIRHLDFTADGYGDPQGLLELRNAIAQYLAASRGVRCDPGQIFITAGTQQALDLICRVLVSPRDTILIEDPCYPPARTAFELNGARLIGIPVDKDGLRMDELEKSAKERHAACYVTPSHHYPLGAALSLQRRLQLLQFARDHACWIIEDDYDSEFRYEGHPIASLQGLDGDGRVLYTGSFSKPLLPAFRTGYLVVPQNLVPTFRALRPALDVFPAVLPQRIIADYLNEGHFSGHLRRLRDRFRASRDHLAARLEERLGDHLIVEKPTQGIYLTARSTGSWKNDVSLAAAAHAAGVTVMPASPLYLSAPKVDRLILGFSGLSEMEAENGLRSLAKAFEAFIRYAGRTTLLSKDPARWSAPWWDAATGRVQ